jgi:tRNA G18 (ribose-2'-O)-methylase SpoU
LHQESESLINSIFPYPQNLLAWLREYRNRGYFVVGLEQTSSSISLETVTFPDQPTILLLGKEKEGIPVEFLQAVDQCVEIPQLGIIRSLNVHVSGAIAIWERTKQLMLSKNHA